LFSKLGRDTDGALVGNGVAVCRFGNAIDVIVCIVDVIIAGMA
jgi:hypothetical protein